MSECGVFVIRNHWPCGFLISVMLGLRGSLKSEVGRALYGKGTLSMEKGLRSQGNCHEQGQKDVATFLCCKQESLSSQQLLWDPLPCVHTLPSSQKLA